MKSHKDTVKTGTNPAVNHYLSNQVQLTDNVLEEVPQEVPTRLHWDKFPRDLQISVVKQLSLKNRVMLKRISPEFHDAIRKVPFVLDDFVINVAMDGIKYTLMNDRFINRHFGKTEGFRCCGYGEVQQPVPGKPFYEAALNSIMMFLSDHDLTFQKLAIRGVVDRDGYSDGTLWFLKKLAERLKFLKKPLNVKHFELYTDFFMPDDLLCLLPHLKPGVLKSMSLSYYSSSIVNLDSIENFEQFKQLKSFNTNGYIPNFRILSHVDDISVNVQNLSTTLVNSMIEEMKKKKNFDGLVLNCTISQPELFRNSLMKSEIREKSELFERRFLLTEINDELVVEVQWNGVYFRTGKQFIQHEKSIRRSSLPFKPLRAAKIPFCKLTK